MFCVLGKWSWNGESLLLNRQFNADLPELLAFYKLHYLDTTPLRRPAQKKVEKVIGKFDFDGSVSWLIEYYSRMM
jgi:hypothetical protein